MELSRFFFEPKARNELEIIVRKSNPLSKVRLLVFDLDNTLLNSQKQIHDQSIEIIHNFYKNGTKVLIATARPYCAVKSLISDLLTRVPCFVASLNGGSLYDESGKCIYRTSIGHQALAIFLDFYRANQNTYHFSWYEQDVWLQNTAHCENEIYSIPKGVEYPRFSRVFEPTSSVQKILVPAFHGVVKLFDHISKETNAILTDNQELLQIMPKDVGKFHAVDWLMQNNDLRKDEVIAFGDDLNDLCIFQNLPYTIAMSNSHTDILSLAFLTTGSNDQPDSISRLLSFLY